MCSVFECCKEPEDDSVEIKHGEHDVCKICKNCLEGADGVRIMLKKTESGYILRQIDLLEKIF